jgi:hypothetical protein
MAVADDIPRSWGLSSLAALLVIAVGPPWLCIAKGASWRLVAAGALIWLASVYAKRLVMIAGRALTFRPVLPQVTVAALQGAISAATELGAAAAFLATLSTASWIDIVGFGVGAGCFEAGYVLLTGIIGPQADPDELLAWVRGATVSWCVRYAVPIERLFALIGHIGARGLVYVALADGAPLGVAWALSAVLLFTAIDGVAVYGHLQKWRWRDPTVCRRAHSFFGLLSIAEFALFLVGFEPPGRL